MSSSSIGSSSSGTSGAQIPLPPPETGVPGGQAQAAGGKATMSGQDLDNAYVATGDSQFKKEGGKTEAEAAIPTELQGTTENQSLKEAKLESTGVITGKNITLEATIPKAASSFLNPPGYFDAPAEKPLSMERMMEGFGNLANVFSNPAMVVADALLTGVSVNAGAIELIEALATGSGGGGETSTASSSSSSSSANGVTTTTTSTTDASGNTSTTVSTTGQPEDTVDEGNTGTDSGGVQEGLNWRTLYGMIGELFEAQMNLQAEAFDVGIKQTNLSIETTLDRADKMESMAMTGLITGMAGASISLGGAAVSGYGAMKAGAASAAVTKAHTPTTNLTAPKGTLNTAMTDSANAATSAKGAATANANLTKSRNNQATAQGELDTANQNLVKAQQTGDQGQIDVAQAELVTAQSNFNAANSELGTAQTQAAKANAQAKVDLSKANTSLEALDTELNSPGSGAINDSVNVQAKATSNDLRASNAKLGEAAKTGNVVGADAEVTNIKTANTKMEAATQKFDADLLKTKYDAGSQSSQMSQAVSQVAGTVGDFVGTTLNGYFEKMNQADLEVLSAEGTATKAAADSMTQTVTDTNNMLKSIRDTMASVRSAQLGTIPKFS